MRDIKGIKALPLACGKAAAKVRIAPTADELIQTVRVLGNDAKEEGGDEIVVTTVDDYCAENAISSVQILKTDTEGFDLDVLQGAQTLLGAGRIKYVLCEVTIFPDDAQHTLLSAVAGFLQPFGMQIHSFFELQHHPEDGKLNFFNALFRKQ